jgi:hypothetical protein
LAKRGTTIANRATAGAGRHHNANTPAVSDSAIRGPMSNNGPKIDGNTARLGITPRVSDAEIMPPDLANGALTVNPPVSTNPNRSLLLFRFTCRAKVAPPQPRLRRRAARG